MNMIAYKVIPVFLSICFLQGFANSPTLSKPATTDTFANWVIPAIPAQFSFAGEKVPLERSDVKEYFDRNLTLIYYQTGGMLNIMKLANRWFPFIEERLAFHGIPLDFKYLCVAESNLQNLISKAGAVGFWQFMSYTAPGYNLRVNSLVDERYNVFKSTEAACRYLREAYNQFGNWTAAAASYNCGRAGYNSQSTFQQTRNYYDLHLPEETNNYIYRILSFKYIFENAKSLGYNIPSEQAYQPYTTKKITITSSVSNLAQFAKNNGTTYKMLRLLNPWIRGRSLTVTGGKEFELLLPAE